MSKKEWTKDEVVEINQSQSLEEKRKLAKELHDKLKKVRFDLKSEEEQKEISEAQKIKNSNKIVKTVFGWDEKQDEEPFLMSVVAKITLIPYWCFTKILKLTAYLLIPYGMIKDVSKEVFPVAFAFGIIILFMLNGVFISVENIDTLIFQNWFYPFIWYAIQIGLAIAIIGSTTYIYSSMKKELNYNWMLNSISSRGKKFWAKTLIITGILWAIVGIPLLSMWYSKTISMQIFAIAWASIFWYVCYLIYLFVISTFLFLIFKKFVFSIFSMLNREYKILQKQIAEILVSIVIVMLINWFIWFKFLLF